MTHLTLLKIADRSWFTEEMKRQNKRLYQVIE